MTFKPRKVRNQHCLHWIAEGIIACYLPRFTRIAKWKMERNLSWGLSTTHAFYSPKTETVLLPLVIRSPMTSDLTVSVEQQEKRWYCCGLESKHEG